MLGYPAILEKDQDGTLLVSFPDFPEAHTFGDDKDEALVRARDALATIIDAYIHDRQAIPRPSILERGMYEVRLPALTVAKVELYNTMRAARVTKTDLARRLGWHLPQVDRLLDVHHASRLDQLEAAFGVLDKELFVAALQRQAPLRAGAIRSGAAGGLSLSRRSRQHSAVVAQAAMLSRQRKDRKRRGTRKHK
jgi:antitoxin HicB